MRGQNLVVDCKKYFCNFRCFWASRGIIMITEDRMRCKGDVFAARGRCQVKNGNEWSAQGRCEKCLFDHCVKGKWVCLRILL